MCRLQCLVAIFAVAIGAVQSWDYAITNVDQIDFYTNKTLIKSVNTKLRYTDLTTLAYDAVHNMLLFVDRQNDNASIFSYHLATKKFQSLVRKSPSEGFHGVAFDPVESLLFWTDTKTKTIYSTSLKPSGSNNSAYGNIWLQFNDQIPRGIAVDSCRGYVYWSNIITPRYGTIERARFDGTGREVVVNTDIHMPVSLAIDQRNRRIFWADDREGTYFSIESSDLDGTSDSRIPLYKGSGHEPSALTVSKDNVYWFDRLQPTVWKLPKTARADTNKEQPEEMIQFERMFDSEVFGIVANYLLQDQIEGVRECEKLKTFSQNTSAITDLFSVSPELGLFCVRGYKVRNKLECNCHPGYTGLRCDTSVCENYCLHGDCSKPGGKATCSCKPGYFGDRCEVEKCAMFCLNGQCSLNDDHEPVCTCWNDFEGKRCEIPKIVTTSTEASTTKKTEVKSDNPTTTKAVQEVTLPDRTEEPCNCTSNATNLSMYSSQPEHISSDGEFVTMGCNDGWDSIRDPIIMVLGIICSLLCLASAMLFTKMLQLKKRPRIKKRIIVNKNVTPMTARPDQCEITIENCCNMNICETPCFEPRSTIRPTLLDSKPGKEEKKNLIANIEYPDDY